MIIILDSFPASSVAKLPGKATTLSDNCRQWVEKCEAAGHTLLVPAVCYYEVLRELELRNATTQIARFKFFCQLPTRFIPLTTKHLELAAKLWSESRRGGFPTSSNDSLDADVILAAQALSLGLPQSEYVIATTNVRHLSRFVPCEEWWKI